MKGGLGSWELALSLAGRSWNTVGEQKQFFLHENKKHSWCKSGANGSAWCRARPGSSPGGSLTPGLVCGGKVRALLLEDLGDETVRGREMQISMRIQFPPCPGGTECREESPRRCQPCWDQLERKMDLKPRCGYLNVGLLAWARVRYLVRGGGRPSWPLALSSLRGPRDLRTEFHAR